jgi:UDP-GlcNAc:undecaprenyl-phosphate/decaprenyl-phosphate GlcNAc-1-phosphate transferase
MLVLPLFLLFCLAAMFCVGATPPLRRLAIKLGQIDKPDGLRKLHSKPIPLAGGVAILFSSVIALIAINAMGWPVLSDRNEDRLFLVGLFLASILICALGVIDDRLPLRGKYKLGGQLIAVSVVISSGVVIRSFNLFGIHLELGILAVPFTALWLVAAINSLNLIDGMDGLLSSVGLIICLTISVMAVLSGQVATAFLAIALAGALAGFLCYNFPPASVFLGDAGSMLIGLLIGVLAVHSSFKGPAAVALSVPIALLSIPFFDTFAAITRRKLTGRSLYIPDREHFHHCLQRQGLSSRRSLLCVSCFCVLTALGAMVAVVLQNEVYAILTTILAIALLVTTRLFGHSEFLLIKKRISGALSSLPFTGISPHHRAVQIRFHGKADWQKLWSRLVEAGTESELTSMVLDVSALAGMERYHARWVTAQPKTQSIDQWQALLPLSLNGSAVGQLLVKGQRDSRSIAKQISNLADLIDDLESNLATLLCPFRPHADFSSDPEIDLMGSEFEIQPALPGLDAR